MEYRLPCPQCGTPCEAEFVDIGVGSERVEPWACPNCHWIEPTPKFDFEEEPFDD